MKSHTLVRHVFLLLTVVLMGISSERSAAEIHYVQEMNTKQIAALDLERTVVILPGGILEEHGPYLPSFTDGYMNQELTKAVADAVSEKEEWDALVFPLIPLGVGGANELGGKHVFGGTYAVRFATERAVFMDLATELGEQGFRWIFIVHVHGDPNHSKALDQSCDFFEDTYEGGHMVHLFGRMPLVPAEDLRSREEAGEDGMPIHATMDETSLMLHLRPDLVDQGYTGAEAQRGRNPNEVVEVAEAEGWPGYLGSPRLASTEHGAASWELFRNDMVKLAVDILDGVDYRKIPRRANVMSMIPAFRKVNEASLEYDAKVKRKQDKWLASKGLE